jgi:hypothetical protein
MDQATLVKRDRDVGAKVLDALSRTKVPVSLCDWHYVPQLEEWQLIIATSWYDSKGARTTYRALIDSLERAGTYQEVPMRRIVLKSPNDPLVKVMQKEAREQNQGFVHVLKHGTEYSVIFAPIAGPGGSVPAKRFSAAEELQEFLGDDLHLASSAIENALRETARTGASSIYPVSLTTRELKKLRLD